MKKLSQSVYSVTGPRFGRYFPNINTTILVSLIRHTDSTPRQLDNSLEEQRSLLTAIAE
jgi:hypothetical protein